MAYYNASALAQPVNSSIFQTPGTLGIGSDYYDSNEGGQTGYSQFLKSYAPQGGAFRQYMQNQFRNNWGDYGAAQGQNPSLKWSDYLTQNQGKFANDFSGLNQYQRGQRETPLGKLNWV